MSDPQGGGPLGMDAETMLAIGGFVLVFSLVAIGATLFVTPVLAYICVPGGAAPAAIVLGLGILEYHREKQLKEFTTLLKTYRRIRIDELAAKVGKSPLEAERLLSRAIELGYVAGVIDRSADEFVLAGTEKAQVFVERCPHCGGVVNRWAFPEERFLCPYCNVAVEVPPTPASAASGTG